ncbi:MAG TPA: nucleoside hydrolase-like domain-containing protein, partial [Opitutus sp.]|nr:nucleoside hydrolase-like domain-containing protein [Opitutus sp.]
MMKSCPSFALATFLVVAGFVSAAPAPLDQEKSRVVVLTDISNEPDDEESFVRFLVYSNEYDVEALVAT